MNQDSGPKNLNSRFKHVPKSGRAKILKEQLTVFVNFDESEEEEIKVIDSFLPKQLSEEETKKICKEIIESVGASSMKDMGKIIDPLKKKYSDSIDFSKVSIIVKDLLNK